MNDQAEAPRTDRIKAGKLGTVRFKSSPTTASLPVKGLRTLVLPILVTAALYLLKTNEISWIGVACSLVLATLAVAAYFQWREGSAESAAPLFALVVGMFWLSFALPLFWGRETVQGPTGPRYIATGAIDQAMIAAVLGTTALWAGFHLRIGHRSRLRELLLFRSTRNSHAYLWAVTFFGLVALRFLDRFVQLAGPGISQPVKIVAQFTPAAAFSLLVLDYFRGRTVYVERIIIPLYVIGRCAVGMASGWLGSAIGTAVIVALAYAMKWRRLPTVPLLGVLAIILFLQPGKQTFRDRFWYGGETGGVIQRIYEWSSESTRMWKGALLGEGSTEWKELGIATVSRLDLLHQTANVIDFTPAVVPYQHGRLYSYLLVTYIPRFVWPSKPSVNDANRWYQVAYGLTDEENLDSVSIACGFLTEAYINFGWVGVVIVMFGAGIFLDYVERILLSRSSGVYFNALGLALVPQLIAIESQLGQYIAGIAQMIVLTTVVLLPVLVWKRRAERRALAATRMAGVLRPNVSVVQPKPLSPA